MARGNPRRGRLRRGQSVRGVRPRAAHQRSGSVMESSRRHLTAPLAALVFGIGLLTTTAAQSRLSPSQHWVATWGTAQLAYRAPAPPPVAAPPAAPTPPPAPAPGTPQRRFGIPRGVPGLSNQTIRMI